MAKDKFIWKRRDVTPIDSNGQELDPGESKEEQGVQREEIKKWADSIVKAAKDIIRIVHAFHLLKIKRESPDFVFGEMVGSNWWVALILGLLLGVLGVIVILNPLLGLGVIGVVVGCGMITAGINLIFLSTNVWLW